MTEIRGQGGQAEGAVCDITDEGAQIKAFQAHVDKRSSLDLCLLNAGIAEQGRTHLFCLAWRKLIWRLLQQ